MQTAFDLAYIQFKQTFFPVIVNFILNSENHGCIFNYGLKIGFNGLFSKIFDFIISKIFSRNSFGKSLIRHIHEEINSIP